MRTKRARRLERERAATVELVDKLAHEPHPVRDWWLEPSRVAHEVGKGVGRQLINCPECGGIALVNRAGKWRCHATDKRDGLTIAVCNAGGRVVDGEPVTVEGSNNLWRELVT